MIESDPEDEIAEPPMSKYARPDGSTPTYRWFPEFSCDFPNFPVSAKGYCRYYKYPIPNGGVVFKLKSHIHYVY